MKRKFRRIVLVVIMTILTAIFPVSSTLAASQTSRVDCLNGAPTGSSMTMFSNNNILFYNPCSSCTGQRIISGGSCFGIDSTVSANQFWYAEGCLDNGTCTGGLYAGGRNGTSLIMTNNNPFIYNDTMTDDEFGGMQYIYAENYDFEYRGAYTRLTPNGGSSTRKYYWIVLPNQAYTNGFGDTYVATFENMSEPVYFIVFDAHACQHQSEQYCERATENPGGVEIGRQFFGAFTKNAGNYTEVARIVGRPTSLCRINGSGEVLANGSTENATGTVNVSANPSSGNSCSASSTYIEGASADGITADLAWRMAHYYNRGGYRPTGRYGLRNCVEFSRFFTTQLTTSGLNADVDGNRVVDKLIEYGWPYYGNEPKVWSVFSNTSGGHTGVVVGENEDGSFITVEAAHPSWRDGFTDGAGNGRVFEHKRFNDGIYKFAYFGNSLNTDRLNEVLNSSY